MPHGGERDAARRITVQYVVAAAPGFASPRPLVVPVYYRYQRPAPPPVALRELHADPARAASELLFARPAARRMAAVAHRLGVDAARGRSVAAPVQTHAPPLAAPARPAPAHQLGAAPPPAGRDRRLQLARQRRDARRKPGRRAPDLQFHRQLAAGASRRAPTSAGAAARSPPASASSRSVGIPVWLTAERRQRARPLRRRPQRFRLVRSKAASTTGRCRGGFRLDGYLQGGVVGVRSRDLFVDGGFTLTRPVYEQFSAGLRRLGRGPAGHLPRRRRAARSRCACATTSGCISTGASGSPAMPRPGSGPARDAGGGFLTARDLAAAVVCG